MFEVDAQSVACSIKSNKVDIYEFGAIIFGVNQF
jgi:hypothetical protein